MNSYSPSSHGANGAANGSIVLSRTDAAAKNATVESLYESVHSEPFTFPKHIPHRTTDAASGTTDAGPARGAGNTERPRDGGPQQPQTQPQQPLVRSSSSTLIAGLTEAQARKAFAHHTDRGFSITFDRDSIVRTSVDANGWISHEMQIADVRFRSRPLGRSGVIQVFAVGGGGGGGDSDGDSNEGGRSGRGGGGGQVVIVAQTRVRRGDVIEALVGRGGSRAEDGRPSVVRILRSGSVAENRWVARGGTGARGRGYYVGGSSGFGSPAAPALPEPESYADPEIDTPAGYYGDDVENPQLHAYAGTGMSAGLGSARMDTATSRDLGLGDQNQNAPGSRAGAVRAAIPDVAWASPPMEAAGRGGAGAGETSRGPGLVGGAGVLVTALWSVWGAGGSAGEGGDDSLPTKVGANVSAPGPNAATGAGRGGGLGQNGQSGRYGSGAGGGGAGASPVVTSRQNSRAQSGTTMHGGEGGSGCVIIRYAGTR